MSDGFGAPGQGPQGTPPAGAGNAQNQPGPVPPPSGGFGPPPASYGPVVPPAQPVAQPVPPVPQPGPVQPQPVPPQPQPQAPQPQPQPQAPQPAPPWQPQAQPTLPAQQFQPQPPQPHQPQPPRAEPDWEALANRNEAEGKRKRRTKVIGIVAAVVVVGGLAAGGAMLLGKHDDPKPAPVASPATPAPTPPSPAPTTSQGGGDDPSKPIWDASTDPAPQDANALFSAAQVTINGATWNRTTVSLDQPCWDGNSTTGGLGKILGDQGCRQVLRATYVSGDSAVTVGVAVFDHRIQAETAMKNYAGQLKGAAAPGAPAFCANPGCTNTHNSMGRYAYFTVEGSAKGGNAPDATATAAAPGFAEHVKGQLLQRAKAAGKAAPGAPAATPTG